MELEATGNATRLLEARSSQEESLRGTKQNTEGGGDNEDERGKKTRINKDTKVRRREKGTGKREKFEREIKSIIYRLLRESKECGRRRKRG